MILSDFEVAVMKFLRLVRSNTFGANVGEIKMSFS